jgi:hypothetical protein
MPRFPRLGGMLVIDEEGEFLRGFRDEGGFAEDASCNVTTFSASKRSR